MNFDILLSEVKHAIKLCKKNKSAGIDELPYEVYFNLSSELIVYYFLTLCFNHGMVPNEWNKSIIVPIPKVNPSTLEYRLPIEALVSCALWLKYLALF